MRSHTARQIAGLWRTHSAISDSEGPPLDDDRPTFSFLLTIRNPELRLSCPLLSDPVMAASVGVTRSLSSIKRDLLLFDQVVVLGLGHMLDQAPGVPELDAAGRADCEFLIDRQVLLDGPISRLEIADYVSARRPELPGPHEFEDVALEDLGAASPFTRAVVLASTARHPAGRLTFDGPLPGGVEYVDAYAMRIFDAHAAVPVLLEAVSPTQWREFTSTFLGPGEHPRGQDRHVADVVLNRLPFPGPEVPLADVLDFVRDPRTRTQVEGLRLWMARTALREETSDNLAVEVDSMLHDFRRHMEVADMRARDGALSLAVTVPLEVAEELMHLRPKRAFDALFAVRARRADRLEAELRAPGHELAYVQSAVNEFGPR